MSQSLSDTPGTPSAFGSRPTGAEMLDLPPLQFIRFLEHDLRGLLSALDGWWTLLGDDAAAEYHGEARDAIQEKIDDLFELTETIRQYKARQSAQSNAQPNPTPPAGSDDD